MIDPALGFLYFGLPTMVGLAGLAAVKLHERHAPLEEPADRALAPERNDSGHKNILTDCYRVFMSVHYPNAGPDYDPNPDQINEFLAWYDALLT